MKKKLLTLIISAIPFLSHAQLKSTGAVINIGAGASLIVSGDLTNTSAAAINNSGELHVRGNIVNNVIMTSPGSGKLFLDGTVAQAISGTGTFYAKDLLLNNAAGISLSSGLKVDGICSFINGIINAGNAVVPFSFTGNANVDPLNPAFDVSFINGYVSKEGTGNFSFPTGDNCRYQKIDVNITANSAGLTAHYIAANAGPAPFINTGQIQPLRFG